MWLAWETASQIALAIAVTVMVAGAFVDPARNAIVDAVAKVAIEAARVLVLYSIWQYTRRLTITRTDGAMEHARWVWDVERSWHLPSELAWQQATLHWDVFMQAMNIYYGGAHVPAMGAVLIWVFWRHRDRYPAVRNVVAMTTAGCLVIQMIPVAPPRFMTDLGFVDSALAYHQSVYGTGGSGVSNQLAAMPSLHYAWSLIVCLAVLRCSRSTHRWWVIAHPVLTTVAVTVTANHWFLDGVVAAAVMAVAIIVQFVAGRAAPVLRGQLGVRIAAAQPIFHTPETSTTTPPPAVSRMHVS